MKRHYYTHCDQPIEMRLHALWHLCDQMSDMSMLYKVIASHCLWRAGILDDAGMPEFQFNVYVEALTEVLTAVDEIAIVHDDEEH